MTLWKRNLTREVRQRRPDTIQGEVTQAPLSLAPPKPLDEEPIESDPKGNSARVLPRYDPAINFAFCVGGEYAVVAMRISSFALSGSSGPSKLACTAWAPEESVCSKVCKLNFVISRWCFS